MKKYEGSCHCAKVKFSVEMSVDGPVRCNCSFCRRRGATLQSVDHRVFTLISGEGELSMYGSKEYAKHYFCQTCGIQVFTKVDYKGAKSVNVNLGCIHEVDPDSLEIRFFDGANKL